MYLKGQSTIMKKIVVPTDFSAYANKALAYAVELAHKQQARVALVHACDLLDEEFSGHKALIKDYNRERVTELKGKLAEIKEVIQKTEGFTVDTQLYEGPIVTSILQAAGDYGADAIVMGTMGQSGLRRRLLGSKAVGVINKSTIPVITVPHDYTLRELKNIFIAVEDLKEPELLQPVYDLAKAFGAKVHAVVFTEQDAEADEVMTHTRNTQMIEQRLKRTFPTIHSDAVQISGDNLIDALLRLTVEKDIDLLAMITHKRGPLEGLFNSSQTQKLSYRSNVPLLALHEL
jgi:nucleotide-binding universal stress UspA family protein